MGVIVPDHPPNVLERARERARSGQGSAGPSTSKRIKEEAVKSEDNNIQSDGSSRIVIKVSANLIPQL